MAQEKEIKIQLKISLADFLKRIQKKGFKLLHSIKQTDIYFDTPEWFLYENIAALRLRIENDRDHSFSFKKVFCVPKRKGGYYVEEIEIKAPFEDLTTINEILKRLNIPSKSQQFKNGDEITNFLNAFKYFGEQKMPKTRVVYSDGENEVVVDNIEQVGIIVELECRKDEPLDIVKCFLEEDEWERSIEGTSYIWLKNVKGLTSHVLNLERFKSEPEWNVWPNEKEMYNTLNK